MQPQPNELIFQAIVGRALVDADYRSRLVTPDDEAQIAALVEGGMSAEDAQRLLPQLNAAATAVNELSQNFGIVPYAA